MKLSKKRVILMLVLLSFVLNGHAYAQYSDLFKYDRIRMEKELEVLANMEQILINSQSSPEVSQSTQNFVSIPPLLLPIVKDSINERSYFLPAFGISFVTSFVPGCLIGALWGGLIGGAAGGLYILIVSNNLSPHQKNQALTGCAIGTVAGAGLAFVGILAVYSSL